MWYYWRLLVKQRIYKKNKDVLMQLERGERVDKVEEAVGEQAGDYERLLRGMGKWEGEGGGAGGEGGKGGVGGERRRERGKRKNVIADDDDDEDEDGDEDTDRGVERATKRVRLDNDDDDDGV